MVLDRDDRTNADLDNLDLSAAYEMVIEKKSNARSAEIQPKLVCRASPKYLPSLKGTQSGSQKGR
jgi:hypothetical protein